MKVLSFGEYKFCVGQRVAAQVGSSGNWYYGFIVKLISSEVVKVRFDAGRPEHKRKDILLSSVVPVINWELDEKPHPFEELTITDLMPHETVSTKLLTPDPHIFDGLWLYTNNALFKGELRKPAFRVMSGLKVLGYCHNTGIDGTKPTLIEITKKVLSSKNIYEVLVHEMVHQYNFEVKKVNDNHGELFLTWKSKVKSILNVNLNPFADLDYMGTQVDLSKRKGQRKNVKEKYIAALYYPVENNDSTPVYAVTLFKTKEAAKDFYLKWQNTNERQKLMTGVYVKAIVGVKLFQQLYNKSPTVKYNRSLTELSFYTVTNPNVESLLKKASSTQTDLKMKRDFSDLYLYGSANVSAFSFLTKEQFRQLDAIKVAEFDYSSGLISEWVS